MSLSRNHDKPPLPSSMKTIQARLHKLRTSLGLSLRDFARLVSDAGHAVSYESVRQYEDADRKVPAVYIKAVCRATGVEARWVLGLDSDGTSLVEETLDELENVESKTPSP